MFRQLIDTKSGNFLIFVHLYFTLLNFVSADNLNSENTISNIKLVGTITGKHALAILRLENKLEGIYQLNQKILDYTITSISEKSVILTIDKKSITLTLIPIKNRKYYGADSTSNNKTKLATYEYRVNRKTFNSLHNDIQSWLDNIQMKIHLDNGYFTGYRITNIKKNSPVELLGLTEGDIIKGINDVLIKQNAENFITKISQLANANQFTLNMRHKEMDFNLKFLIEDDNN